MTRRRCLAPPGAGALSCRIREPNWVACIPRPARLRYQVRPVAALLSSRRRESGMLAKRTSPYLAPSFEDLTRAQSPAQDRAALASRGEHSESRSMPPLAARILAPDVGSPSDNGASRRERFGPPAPRNPGRSSHHLVAESSSWRIPRDFTAGDREPSHCGARLGRSEPTHPASWPRSHDRSNAGHHVGYGSDRSAWARKSMAARPGAGFAGRPKLERGGGAETLPCGQVDRWPGRRRT